MACLLGFNCELGCFCGSCQLCWALFVDSVGCLWVYIVCLVFCCVMLVAGQVYVVLCIVFAHVMWVDLMCNVGVWYV